MMRAHQLDSGVEMARYVMGTRRAAGAARRAGAPSRVVVARAFEALEAGFQIVGDNEPSDEGGRRVAVFEADPDDVGVFASQVGPGVLIEREILHTPLVHVLGPFDLHGLVPPGAAAPHAGSGTSLRVRACSASAPLVGAHVSLFLRGPGSTATTLEHWAASDGCVTFDYGSGWVPAALIVNPVGGAWSVVVRAPSPPIVDVDAPPLSTAGPLGWWHEALGITTPDLDAGKGIVVGVIDTGVAKAHPALQHVRDEGTVILGSCGANGSDTDGHGSHVCGIIAARPRGPRSSKGGPAYVGVAPGVELRSVRVFASGLDANQGDIASALDMLSGKADLVNLSLGAPVPSQILHESIQDAYDRGTLCVCAAGNTGGAVEYPAAFPECVAVSALGREGWAPAGTLAESRRPVVPGHFGIENLYAANFNCTGSAVACGAPGVGVISTVIPGYGEHDPWLPMDGTSMASPAACGALARMLARDPCYCTCPRDRARADQARRVLLGRCRDVGLKAHLVGRGIPSP